MISRLAWVTAASARGRDDDEVPTLAALAACGVSVDVVNWDDPLVAWPSYERVVLRSTWDYSERFEEFLGWLARVDVVTEIRNPLPMVRWSLDKHYLAELDAAGVPVVPTTFVEPGENRPLPEGLFVIKPSIGAASRDVRSFQGDHLEAARAHVSRLHARGITALVQPLIGSVAREGEYPLVFLGEDYSHAAVRHVTHVPHDDSGHSGHSDHSETSRPHRALDGQVAVAQAAMEFVTERFGVPTYARVDLVNDDDGRPCVLEVEVAEPSLFVLEGGPAAVHRLARAISS